jgi:glycosyltransferase involved in cell wall biosynthesis
VSVRLSLCMIVRNEAAVLSRCLASVADVVDEMIVVDTGSTDATREIARQRGATVIEHDFSRVDFAAARNRGLAHARGRAVLVLDADEVLDPAALPRLREYVDAHQDVGLVVDRRNFLPLSPTPTWVDHVVRVFPNGPAYRYRHRVHETIDDAILAGGGRLRRSGITLNHFMASAPRQRTKWSWYVELLLAELAEGHEDPDRLVFLAADYHKLEQFQDAVAVADRIAELRPDDFTARFTAALYHYAYAGDPARARHELRAALRLRPHDPEAQALRREIDR